MCRRNAISQFLAQIQEAENVLKYTLQLPQVENGVIKLPELPLSEINKEDLSQYTKDLENSMCAAADLTYNNCDCLFRNSNPNIYGYKSNMESDLSILSVYLPFWKHAFKQDMILSAFIRLRELIGKSIDLTTYEFVQLSNYANDKNEIPSSFGKRHHGLDYLMGCTYPASDTYIGLKCNDSMTFELNKILNSSASSEACSSYAPNYQRKIKSLYNKLSPFNKHNRYFKPSEKDNMPQVDLSTLEFWEFCISQKDNNGSKCILSIINSHKENAPLSFSAYNKYIECISSLHLQNKIEAIDKNIEYTKPNNITEHNMSLSDKIYLRYQIENIFSPVMIDCMYRSIYPTANTPYALDDQATINTLSSCLSLPNVFTRQYIFQMGIDTITKHYDYNFADSDFFSQYRIDPRVVASTARPKTDYMSHQTALSTFLTKYANFINYLGHMLLPVYENYFFILLWKSIRYCFPEKSEMDCILHLYKLLSHLLNDNEYVEKLFSIEDVILYTFRNFHKLKPEHILHPSFSTMQEIDTHLYKRCLLSQNITVAQEPVPNFLNLRYLNSLANEPSKYVQAHYICSFSTM